MLQEERETFIDSDNEQSVLPLRRSLKRSTGGRIALQNSQKLRALPKPLSGPDPRKGQHNPIRELQLDVYTFQIMPEVSTLQPVYCT